MITKKKKEMEYEEAPSGYVTLYNYKEPFMKYEGGYGFQGVLMFNGEDDKVQCHLCGEWFEYLPNHLHREHATSAADYKEMVGLSQTTALIGEKQRANLIATHLDLRKKNLRPGGKKTEAEKKKISETLKKLSRERQNLRGTCPEQLIERIRQTHHSLGRTPHENEIKGKETIVRVFGTWKAACEIAGIPYLPPGKTYTKRTSKVVEAEMIIWIRGNIVAGVLPKQSDYARAVKLSTQTVSAWVRRNGGWQEVCRRSLVSDGIYRKISGFRYTKADLLKFLVDFKKNHGRNPAVSDCKRGLLPYYGRYHYYWKNWKNTLKAAGL